jgi:D-glycero-alpha-D-manno-heptose 1-phosphate guanylyltransferase
LLKEAIILAGGFGTRLQSVVNDVPKPMASINNEPFLNYVFDLKLKYFIV